MPRWVRERAGSLPSIRLRTVSGEARREVFRKKQLQSCIPGSSPDTRLGKPRLRVKPIFVTNRDSLDEVLKSIDSSHMLERFGRLELENEEFAKSIGYVVSTKSYSRCWPRW